MFPSAVGCSIMLSEHTWMMLNKNFLFREKKIFKKSNAKNMIVQQSNRISTAISCIISCSCLVWVPTLMNNI